MQVSVLSECALVGGVGVKVVADVATASQKGVLAHGGPLPLPLQRVLAPSTNAQRARVAGGTAFLAPQNCQKAHVDVPEVRSFVLDVLHPWCSHCWACVWPQVYPCRIRRCLCAPE